MSCFSHVWDKLCWDYALWENFSSLETKYFTSYIFFRIAFFSGVPKKKTFYYIRNIPAALEALYFFQLDNMFYLVSFLLTCMTFKVLGKHLLLHQRNMFYHFLCFREIAFARLHIYYLRLFRLNYVFAVEHLHLSQISVEGHISSP